MNEELNLSCRYKVSKHKHEGFYSFDTDGGAQYRITFQASGDLFISTPIEHAEIYSIVIIKTQEGDGRKDPHMSETIAEVIGHFFEKRNRILIYQCLTDNGRHNSRKKMFDGMFNTSQQKNFLKKINGTVSNEDTHYHCSMLYHKETMLDKSSIEDSFNFIVDLLNASK